MEGGGSSDSEEYLTPEEEMAAGEEQEKGMSPGASEKDTSQTRERGSRRGQKKHGERTGGKVNSPDVPVKKADKTVEGIAIEPGGTEEEAPVPPPRRKRKKKQFQKQSSLEDLDQLPLAPFPRSLTIGSIDMSREALAERISDSPLKGSPRTKSPPDNVRIPPRERREAPPKPSREESKSHPTKVDVKVKAMLRTGTSESPESEARAATPAILIEPNTSLELTEDMISSGESEVITTAADTPLAKARQSSGDPMVKVIFPSDDESDGPDEDVDAGVRGEDGGARKKAVMRAEGGGGTNAKTEKRSRPYGSPTDESKILEKTMIKNLDTGEAFPLSAAEERIPRGWGLNPLSEHLIRRTNELALGDSRSHSMDELDDVGDDSQHRRKPLKKKLKHLFGKRKEGRHVLEGALPSDEELMPPSHSHSHTHTHAHAHGTERDKEQELKYKPSSHYKGPLEFDKVRLKQDLSGHHLGAVWVMEFSICGRLLATAGQDSVVRVWVLRTAYQFFHELQAKYQRFGVHSSGDSLSEKASVASTSSSKSSDPDEESKMAFLEQPLCSYYGHQADILDVSWSKNFFLLSSSMDKTVRLWHISRKECLCCFQHVDFVTAIAFHPRDDRYFLSGSLDGKIRLWNIPDKRVALWNEIEFVGSRLITAANFCMNGKLAVAGTYDGRCIFYETEHLKYHTQIQVRSRHGKNKGRKISGVEPLPGEDKLLVTSNDSRTRLYNLKDHSLSCKYKGGLNTSSQIKSTFSRDGQYIISGSEDNYIYIWKTHHDVSKLSSARRDRNEYYESFGAHSAPVTAAVFAPVPGITVDEGLKEVGQMIVAADYQGCIKVYVNSEQL